MILVTGGCGFLGSNLIASLRAETSVPVVVCDTLGSGYKWKNLRRQIVQDVILPDELGTWIADNHRNITFIFALGGLAPGPDDTPEQVLDSYFRRRLRLWRDCVRYGIRLLYTSSADTYGDGSQGFDDTNTPEHLERLRPLTATAWSQHLLDVNVLRQALAGLAPPQWVGLKVFDAYGPNEYHKGNRRSTPLGLYEQIRHNARVKLYKSARPDFRHGEQRRDFIWVIDCVRIMLWFYHNPEPGGIFNCGTGVDRSLNDLARILFRAMDTPEIIEYTTMPEELRRHYQYYTRADIRRLRTVAGYPHPFTPLDEGIRAFLYDHLMARSIFRA